MQEGHPLLRLPNSSFSIGEALLLSSPIWAAGENCISSSDGTFATTFQELITLAAERSDALSRKVAPGQRIALLAESGPSFSAWLLAILWRHTAVPISPKMNEQEILTHCGLTGTKYLLDLTGEFKPDEPASDSELLILQESDLGGDSQDSEIPEFPCPDAIAVVLLTSGSTGAPKAVPLSHRNLLSGSIDVIRSLALSSSDRVLVLWSQQHIGGIVDLLLAPLLAGCQIVNDGEFSLNQFNRGLTSARPTWIQTVPTTLSEIVRDRKKYKNDTLMKLRFTRCVAAPLSKELWVDAEEVLGCPIVHTYGMTEASPLITSTAPSWHERVIGSSGKPISNRLKIVNSNGAESRGVESGAIWVAGPGVFSGYEGDSKRTPDDEEWFDTGDIGRLGVGGELYVLGRQSAQINRGGEKLNPREIEVALSKVSGVLEASVFGVAHPRLGEVPVAAIIPHQKISAERIRKRAITALPPRMVPADFFFLVELPRNGVGKTDNRALSSMYEAHRQRRVGRKPTATERIVKKIWELELDQSSIGLSQSFLSAGGDSLSAVRIMAVIEDTFSITDMSWSSAGLDTIEEIAAAIDATRLRLGLRDRIYISAKAYFEGDNAQSVRDYGESLRNAKTSVQRLNKWEKALTHLTASEYYELHDSLEDLNAEWAGDRKFLPSRTLAFQKPWRRTPLGPNLTLYSREKSDLVQSQTALAFLSSNFRLLLPVSTVLENIPDSVDQFVAIFDNHRNHYESGVGGIEPSIKRLPAGIRRAIGGLPSRELIVLGASAGALAALWVGEELSAASIGVLAPDRLDNHRLLGALLRSRRQLGGCRPTIQILSGQVKRDVEAVRQIRTMRQHAVAHWLGNAHNVLRTAIEEGSARDYLAWLCGLQSIPERVVSR
jgi:acyl-CoA synthetase (AMP-forming)/AMP-acid ligase II/acyl carrier protein